MKEQPGGDASNYRERKLPGKALVAHPLDDRPEPGQSHERLEGGVGERVRRRQDGNPQVASLRRSGDHEQEQDEREQLRAKAEDPRDEGAGCEVEEERNDDAPVAHRVARDDPDDGEKQSVEERQGEAASDDRIHPSRKRDEEQMKEELLVAIRLAEDAQARPGEPVGIAALRELPRDRQVEVGVAVGDEREREEEDGEDEERNNEEDCTDKQGTLPPAHVRTRLFNHHVRMK